MADGENLEASLVGPNRPYEALRQGVQILDPVMRAHGFEYGDGSTGACSGGPFVSGEFVRGDRRLELHFRFSLGLVTYHIGRDALRHELYMRALLGPNLGNRYPGFSDDTIEGFRGLRYDLETFAGDFLSGSGEAFRRCLLEVRAARALSGMQRMEQKWPPSLSEVL
jgi:hypothetical protein